MGFDAINDDDSLVKRYNEFVVLLGPEAGTTPGPGDTFANVFCVQVVQSAGSRVDFASLT